MLRHRQCADVSSKPKPNLSDNSEKMTPTQFYFPYFFILDKFNKTLLPFGLFSYSIYDEETKMPNELIISLKKDLDNLKSNLLTIPFGSTLMIEMNKLFYWETDTNQINITQVELPTLFENPEILNTKIDLTKLDLGKNNVDTYLETDSLVAYVRKEDLTYQQEYFEKFVIVIIERNQVEMIPFDWFNKTGGDYGYVWPATAQFDRKNNLLYGQGMRMPDFKIAI